MPISFFSIHPSIQDSLEIHGYNHINLTDNGVIAGNAKIFRVDVVVDPGWSNMDIQITGDLNVGIKAVGARIVHAGTVAYFPPVWSVHSLSGKAGVLIRVEGTV